MSESLETLHLGPDLARIDEESSSLHGSVDTIRVKDSRNKFSAGAKAISEDLSEGRERNIVRKTNSARQVSSLHFSFFLPYQSINQSFTFY